MRMDMQSCVDLYLLSCDNFHQSFREWLISGLWLRGEWLGAKSREI